MGNTPLSPKDIQDLLQPDVKPHMVVWDDLGNKHVCDTESLPSNVVGGYVGTKGNPRKYIAGDRSIIAYKVVH
jgi:hypothetical protein